VEDGQSKNCFGIRTWLPNHLALDARGGGDTVIEEERRGTETPEWNGKERRKNNHFIKKIAYGLVGWAVLMTLAMGYMVNQNHKGAREGHASKTALCVLKADLRKRVRTANEFLLEHPQGAFGIPRSVILTNIVNQQKTLKALDVLTCPPEVENGS
jgi:hypothetical protein